MAVLINQTPNTIFDQAYGPNPVTLSGIPVDPITGILLANKYVLQIYRNGELIADLRQTPNRVARAIFDIQNVLQNFVSPSINSVEQTGFIGDSILNSAKETTPYELHAGFEDNVGVTIQTIQPGFISFGGSKEYFEVPYDPIEFIPVLATPECTTIVLQGKPFTEQTSYRMGIDITDGKPTWLLDSMRVYDHYVTASDMTTISYYNQPSGTGPILAQSIESFVFYQYNNSTLVSIDQLPNIQGDGGGPNVNPGDGIIPEYPYKAVTVGAGPRNFQAFAAGTTTHYYIATGAYTPCTQTVPGIADGSMHYVHRFNIIEEACNDFPEYQFSWLNKYGFRDYYSFRKRKDRSVQINRNTYLKESANYNSTSYDVNIYDRGTTVYSQALEETFTAFTNYISNEDAIFLEGLYTSADVKVRFNDANGSEQFQWVPIALISSSYTEKTTRKDQLFQYDIKFKKAHNLKSQRG